MAAVLKLAKRRAKQAKHATKARRSAARETDELVRARVGKTGPASAVRSIDPASYVVVASVAPPVACLALVERSMSAAVAEATASAFVLARARSGGHYVADMLAAAEYLAGRRMTRAEAVGWIRQEHQRALGWTVPAFALSSAITADGERGGDRKGIRAAKSYQRAVDQEAKRARRERAGKDKALAARDTRSTKG